VWSNVRDGVTAGIEGRLVRADGAGQGPVLPIHGPVPGIRSRKPQIARSNGRGHVAVPQWLVVWEEIPGTGPADVYARRFTTAGTTASGVLQLATTPADEREPQVSSAADLGVDGTGFLVVWTRPTGAHAALVSADAANITRTRTWDLTTDFGIGRFSPRAESDGARFLVASSAVEPFTPTIDQTRVRTLAWNGSALLQHDGPTTLPGVVPVVEIASHRSGGGLAGDYAFVHLQPSGFLTQPVLTRYAGVAAGAMTQVVPMACHGLQIAVTGSSAIGAALQFTLANFGSDFPAFAFGFAAPAPIALCPTCAVGLRMDLPIVSSLGSAALTMAVPPSPGLVGQSFAVQGASLGSGSCLGGLAFSDTVVCTIR
jgi:hypothetical protein